MRGHSQDLVKVSPIPASTVTVAFFNPSLSALLLARYIYNYTSLFIYVFYHYSFFKYNYHIIFSICNKYTPKRFLILSILSYNILPFLLLVRNLLRVERFMSLNSNGDDFVFVALMINE